MGKVTLDGDLKLRQTWAFSSKGGWKLPYANNALLNVNDEALSAQDASINELMTKSNARNCKHIYIYI